MTAGPRGIAWAPVDTHGRASDEVRTGRGTAAVEPHLAGPAWGARAERAAGLAPVATEEPVVETCSVRGGAAATSELAVAGEDAGPVRRRGDGAAERVVGVPGEDAGSVRGRVDGGCERVPGEEAGSGRGRAGGTCEVAVFRGSGEGVRSGGGAGGRGPWAAAPVADDDTQDLPRVGAGVPGPGIASGRHLIGSPGATAIPVHLLFRDQGAGTGSVPGPAGGAGPARGGTADAGGARRRGGGALDARTAAGTPTAPGARTAPAPRTRTRTAPTPRHGEAGWGTGARSAPPVDPVLRERRGPAVPGWVGVLAGAGAAAGAALVAVKAGLVPGRVADALGIAAGAGPTRYHWAALAALGVVALVALGGLGRGRAGHAWVLTLFGSYRGTVRRTGLVWVSPALLRRRVDVRLRHWRSEPMPAVDAGGLALQVVVQVVWRVKDTARAALAVEDHTDYLAEQVESAMARVLSRLPADAFHEDAPTLRDAEAVGDALTRMLAADTEVAGIEVYSAQPTRIEYAPEVAAAMRRRRVAAIDAKHRDAVLNSVVDAVDDTVNRLTSRGLVELDDYERKALVKDLTVAFYTGRQD
ncbi:SPFH domain-containing protein [Streptomyces sp. NPDC101132]|uniref:SPFH domain-containing protein n=1 Tax=Streptomyces sp. NPDC101132 TaxID=3366110 RepID=UPI00380810D0